MRYSCASDQQKHPLCYPSDDLRALRISYVQLTYRMILNFKLVSAGLGALLLASTLPARAQLPFDSIALTDLGAFRSPGANWRIAGGAGLNPATPQHLAVEPGTGVIANTGTSGSGSNLVSRMEHGDIELELDFMLPRGGNSGVYLQGRYELQLLDSWGKRNPTYGDAGGIYQRWDPSRGRGREGYEGVPPRINASRAPGLWQHMRVQFQAPRFDARGNKTANARFVRVELNGAVIHENVEVTGPTRGPLAPNERAMGPLLIQGDHGPVALRRIRFKRYSGESITLSNLRFQAFEAETGEQAYTMSGAPAREGIAENIASGLAGAQDKFALLFQGTMEVPVSGRYRFDLGLDWVDSDPQFKGTVVGGGRLTIGGREVLVHPGREPRQSDDVQLRAGRHPFTLAFYKNRPWTNRTGITLFAEGPQVERHALHAASAVGPQTGAITVQPEGNAVVLRSFVQHGTEKRTHAVNVGDPTGIHYSFDLARGALLQAWRGPFLETTPMWHERGNDQLAMPLGSTVALSGAPALAFLVGAGAVWPDSVPAGAYTLEGYELDAAQRPTFRYRVRGLQVEDQLRPAADSSSLRRALRVRGPEGTGGLFLRLAAADTIRALPDGTFVVGDRGFYVAPGTGTQPVIRAVGNRQELLAPVELRGGEANLSYTITW